jgi:hypothetical protein
VCENGESRLRAPGQRARSRKLARPAIERRPFLTADGHLTRIEDDSRTDVYFCTLWALAGVLDSGSHSRLRASRSNGSASELPLGCHLALGAA